MNVTTIKVSMKKRTAAQIEAKVALSDPSVASYETTLDFSKLTEEQVLQWAQRGVVIHLQAQLKSGSLTDEQLKGKNFVVPEPGDRARLSDTDKVRRMVASLLGKKVEDVTDAEVMKTIQSVMGTQS